jgi:hypothetical protein
VTQKSRIDKLAGKLNALNPELRLVVITALNGAPGPFGPSPIDGDTKRLEAALRQKGLRVPAAIWRGSVEATVDALPRGQRISTVGSEAH